MKNSHSLYGLIYGIIFALLLIAVLFAALMCRETSLKDEMIDTADAFDSGWHNSAGDTVDISKLRKAEGVTPYEEYSIFNTLPHDVHDAEVLYFRSKNIFYSVYIDGRLVYKPEVPESIFYNDSFGTRWNIVELSSEDGGKEIEIRFMTVYDSGRASVDNIYIGSSGGLILDTISEKLVAFITCVLILFVGVLLMVADIPINFRKQKNHELLYLGLFSVSVAIWCIVETNLFQLFFADSRLLQTVSCTSLMFLPVPIILYLDSVFGFRAKWLTKGICILSGIEFILCWTLHLLGIADIHQTLIMSHALILLSAVLMFYSIAKYLFKKRKARFGPSTVYLFLKGLGFYVFALTTMIDVFRYYSGDPTDAAMFVRIGVLVFIICFGVSSLETTIKAVKTGVQTKLVQRLAYMDGLTGVGNRTAFEERITALEKVKDERNVGIIMFDVNDLKYVNDHLGHHFGDDMLIKSADIICTSFEPLGAECFRIGGDEFAVLLGGDDLQKSYETGIEKFTEEVKLHNDMPEKHFRISIAHGFAVYSKELQSSKLIDIYQQADKKMYENKKEMKAVQSRPEEYYRDMIPAAGSAT
ncbi:MAG: diguanylate cyclase [Oscillospiraceae bacterium]|nr:diguanylate cyclase [Oscillospiraceae bacterium]